MRKSVFVLAVIAAACSSVAFAAEVKKEKAHVPAVKATTMSDADMDKVIAGFSSDNNGFRGAGIGASSDAQKGQGAARNLDHGRF